MATDHKAKALAEIANAKQANAGYMSTGEASASDALCAIAHALLDVADAIREQTYAEGERGDGS